MDIVSGSAAVKIDPITNFIPIFAARNNGCFFRSLYQVTCAANDFTRINKSV